MTRSGSPFVGPELPTRSVDLGSTRGARPSAGTDGKIT